MALLTRKAVICSSCRWRPPTTFSRRRDWFFRNGLDLFSLYLCFCHVWRFRAATFAVRFAEEGSASFSEIETEVAELKLGQRCVDGGVMVRPRQLLLGLGFHRDASTRCMK